MNRTRKWLISVLGITMLVLVFTEFTGIGNLSGAVIVAWIVIFGGLLVIYYLDYTHGWKKN